MFKSNDLVETKTFACIAEAVAHYHKRGFINPIRDDEYSESRIMKTDTQEVWIRHDGKTAKERFLNVKATVINN